MTQKYNEVGKEFVKEFNKKANESEKIVITGHISPDDDAISSVLAIYYHLTSILKIDESRVEMIFTGSSSDRWAYFNNYERIEFVDDIANKVSDNDLLILLDASSWYRFTRKEDFKFNGDTICIDHHPNPKDEFDLHLLSVDYVSCAEIIYKLFFQETKLDENIAETIFLGIWGDTGGLRFVKKGETSVFDIVKKLVDEGDIDIQLLESKYQKMSLDAFNLINVLMQNTKIERIDGWPAFQSSYVTRDELDKTKKSGDNIEGYHRTYMDQYLRMVKGADWGFVITPKEDGKCGISFRSLPGSVNVREIAESLGGGGHDRASGATIEEEDPAKAMEEMLNWMKENEPVIS